MRVKTFIRRKTYREAGEHVSSREELDLVASSEIRDDFATI